MILDKETRENEKAYLERVVKEVRLQLDNGINAVENFKKQAVELQKEMWEEVKCTPTSLFDLEDPTTIWQYQSELSNQARKYKFSYEKVSRLERMLKSPYFGRIDFLEEGENSPENIYIGIHNLSTKNMQILVYDWRAPISGMFYDFEPGPCGYECPVGLISGQMLLKRQFKIEDSNIVYMFDSSLNINDEMLQDILGKSTDNRMKTIVSSIQKEQNAVIRNIQNKVLIVDGPAGSGKTSIALHRAAYLLYKYKEHIKSENILVFSPNHVFEDYISHVLPELGEENIQRSTFSDFFMNLVDKSYKVESMNHQMEFILSCKSDHIRLKCIRFKASLAFLDILKKYIRQIENGLSLKFENIIYDGSIIISSDEIWELFKNDYGRLLFAKRLEKLQQRLLFLVEQYEENRLFTQKEQKEGSTNTEHEFKAENKKLSEELESLKTAIIQMTSFDIYNIYRELCKNLEAFADSDDIQELENLRAYSFYTIRQMEQGILKYEDIGPIIFLKTSLDTVSDTKSVKHVIIDEAQDYTAVQYEIIKKAFGHSNMTILGDVNQTVNKYMNVGSFNLISDIFKASDANTISLTKSYRSSKEIADFCKEIVVPQTRLEQLERHGSKPKLIKLDKSDLPAKLSADIAELKSKGHKLIAVICKTTAQCQALYNSISTLVDISLISNQNDIYIENVVIIPSYLAKGLEFDAVLVVSVEEEEFSQEDRRLLYTVCTRALHELYLYYFDDISDLIKNIGRDFYHSITFNR